MSESSCAGEGVSETAVAAILQGIDDGFYVLDAEWRFVTFNDHCERYFGRARKAVLGRRYTEAFPQARGSLFEAAIARAIETRTPQRVEAPSPTTGVPILLRVFPADGHTAVLFTDVCERYEAEEALRRSEARYRTLFESMDEGFCVVEMLFDDSGKATDYLFIEVNPAFHRQTGLADPVGHTMRELAPGHEDHWFEIYGEVARTGRPIRFEQRAEKLGDRWYAVSAFRVGEPEEARVGILFEDVTERHRSQEALRELNEALEGRVAERTAELEEVVKEMEAFNYSVSHDLRAPLRNVSGMAAILLDEAGPDLKPEHRHLLERQTVNVRKMAQLLDELLRLSRLSRAEVHRMPLDLTAKARDVVEIERASHPSPATVEVQEGMRAEADPNLVRALLQNLIGNALKYSPKGGTIRVGQEGDAFVVSDEGVGFDMAHAAKIFHPFERLVRESEFPGTGIGLANVERIVRRHGGRVWAESEPGKGSTFRFTLSPPTNG